MIKKLRDIAIIGAGQGAPQGDSNYCDRGTPFVKAGNLQELLEGKNINDIQQVSDEVAKKHKLKLYPKGTILFAKSGMSCMKGYVYVLPQDAHVVSHLACVTPIGDNSAYLRYYFAFHKPNQLVKDAAYPSISLSDIGNLEVDMKSFSERIGVVNRLQHIESIISLRQKELGLLNELIKARFVEMFGDPIKNPKDWKMATIGDVVKEVRYGTSKPAVEGGKYPYLRMNNITADGHIDLSDLKYIDIPDDEIEKCVVRKGDVLFNRTNSTELVGKTAVFDLPEDMVIAGYIIRVRLNDSLLPDVLAQYMNLEALKDILRRMAKGAVNQANINAQELQGIKVYVPDMELQKAFIKVKEQVDKSKVVLERLLSKYLKKALVTCMQAWL